MGILIETLVKKVIETPYDSRGRKLKIAAIGDILALRSFP